jgi:predicted RNA-binding protein
MNLSCYYILSEGNSYFRPNIFRDGKLSENSSLPSISGNRKWLLVATNENWKKCLEIKSWGVKERYKHTIQRMKVGDDFLVHLTENKTAGICKVTREYYYDTHPIWDDENIYPHRIGFEPVKIPPKPIDAKESYDRYLKQSHGTSGGYFGNPIRYLPDSEFSIFESGNLIPVFLIVVPKTVLA